MLHHYWGSKGMREHFYFPQMSSFKEKWEGIVKVTKTSLVLRHVLSQSYKVGGLSTKSQWRKTT